MITEQMAQAYDTDQRVMRAIEALTGGDFSNGSSHPENDDDPAVVEWREGNLSNAELTQWLDQNEPGWREEAPLSWGAGQGVSPVMADLTDVDDAEYQ